MTNAQVSDPKRGRVNSPRRWIYRDFPDTTARSFDSYPIIVINHADLGSDDTIVLNATLAENQAVFDLEIYADYDDPKVRCDTISSDIMEMIYSEANKATMEAIGFFNPVISGTNTSTTSLDAKKLVLRRIRVSYTIDICTTA
jgi:hypothetical protein